MHPSFVLILVLALTACKTRPAMEIPEAVKPYKAEVVQGNFVSSEQVAALRAGMPKNQVRYILGTPLLVDIFHANRWDYVFTIERQGVLAKTLRLTVHFNGDTLTRWEGDAMLGEAEFVQSLTSGRKIGAIPPLAANEKDLAAFAARENKGRQSPATADTASQPINSFYPPLELK